VTNSRTGSRVSAKSTRRSNRFASVLWSQASKSMASPVSGSQRDVSVQPAEKEALIDSWVLTLYNHLHTRTLPLTWTLLTACRVWAAFRIRIRLPGKMTTGMALIRLVPSPRRRMVSVSSASRRMSRSPASERWAMWQGVVVAAAQGNENSEVIGVTANGNLNQEEVKRSHLLA
jgi:hypothetical protein